MFTKASCYGLLLLLAFSLTSFAATIHSFSPTTISAGTTSLLTINGADFGTTRGSVLFRDADNGGVTFIQASNSEIVSWSATTIVVKVPQDAGTGQISVIANGLQIYSSGILTVKYAVLDGPNTSGIEPIRVRNDNGAGGYTFQLANSFDANAPANASFKRALESWKCNTNINWVIGPKTTVNTVAADDINVVKFGSDEEVEDGILGYTQSYWRRCSSGKWELSDIDIVFNNRDYNWNYTTNAPTSNQFDFETVALHELGHAHSLGHVINPLDPMHYAIGFGSVNRSLSALNIEAGKFVISNSAAVLNGSCVSPLAPLPTGSCNAAVPTITSFTPTNAPSASVVTITGTNFINTLGVHFADIPASSFTVVSATTLTAVVASGATGNVTVTTPGGIAIASGFTYNPKLTQSLTASPLPTKTFGDVDFDPGVTSSAGLPVTYASSNTLVATIVNDKIHIVGAGTAIITASQAGNATYSEATPVNLNLLVNKANQTITFPALSAKQINDADFDPGASASSGLTVSYTSSDLSVATIVAGKIHIVGAGIATITATQAGNTNIAAATPVAVQLVVNKLPQTISFIPLGAKEISIADFDPGASASSGLALSYASSNLSVATIVAGKIRILGAGTATITATQSGNAIYAPAVAVAVQLVVNKANQIITFPAIPLKNYNDADFDPNATASSGLAVNYSSSNTAVATIVNGKVHIVASGTADIKASQAGNTNYNAAAEVLQTLEVVYTLPANNFSLKVTDETCKTSNNGSITLVAAQNLNYTATLSVNNQTITYPFNTALTIDNLQAGSYTLCITVAGQPNYKQCFELVIREPKDLAVYSILRDNGNAVLLKLEGSTLYKIDVNGQLITTNDQEILIPLKKGNNTVKIASDLSCQGVITKNFLTASGILLYPNPVKNVLNINTGSNDSALVNVEIYALDGRLVQRNKYLAEYGQVSVAVSTLNKGLYVLTLTIGNSKTVHKVVKE